MIELGMHQGNKSFTQKMMDCEYQTKDTVHYQFRNKLISPASLQ